MRRLSRSPGGGPWLRRFRADERGAVAATVAIVLGTGVLLGFSALVVDVGRLYAERQQLQTGADAAAWAVAEECVQQSRCGTSERQLELAERYAVDNAHDDSAAVAAICGNDEDLGACVGPSANNLTDCLGDTARLAAATEYVEVRTSTLTRDGGELLLPTLAQMFAGPVGTQVGACARVAWGPPTTATAMGFTFSECEWQSLTRDPDDPSNDQPVLWAPPAAGEPDPPDSAEVVIPLNKGSVSGCPAARDAPGAYGWLEDTDGGCSVTVTIGDPVEPQPGQKGDCQKDDLLSAWKAERRVNVMPIYRDPPPGGRHDYEMVGFASFVLTGYKLHKTEPSWLTGRTSCDQGPGNSARCLFGYFTRGVLPTTGAELGGRDFGTSIINLVG